VFNTKAEVQKVFLCFVLVMQFSKFFLLCSFLYRVSLNVIDSLPYHTLLVCVSGVSISISLFFIPIRYSFSFHREP
jgi:hypothetical protein